MDFLSLCQALGLALAAGLIVGAAAPSIMPAWGVAVGAGPLGILIAAASLNAEEQDVWVAIPLGALAAAFAGIVTADVTAGAARRAGAGADPADAQPSAGVVAYTVMAALALTVLSLLFPPVSLIALAALLWLWLSRRRRGQQKHEGLRVLR